MKCWVLLVSVALPVALSESVAWKWTHPPFADKGEPVLDLIPSESAAWQLQGNAYREVQPSLACSTGWIADIAEGPNPTMRLAFFKWDQATSINTMEAFRHLPDECMGSIGMDLEKVHPARVADSEGNKLIFDSSLFRPRGGGQGIHVFKAVWVSGMGSVHLRNALLGTSGSEMRSLRLAAAASRFKPRHARVIMGAVAGMPTEDLAWHRFSTEVLPQLQWPQEKPAD